MPTIQIERYKFRFYSSDMNEPPHAHVIDGEKVAKVWLQPVSLEYNRGYNKTELNYILRLARQHAARLMERWNEYFNR